MDALYPVTIRGVGSYAPEEVLDNAFFERILDTSDEWIVTRTGIRERRRAAPDQSSSHLAAEAARAALADAGLAVEDIDLLIVATATPDYAIPSAACIVHDHLGFKGTPAFDVGAACSGFLYASFVAANLIKSGVYGNILVIGTETLTRVSDLLDRTSCVLFGDGAGAMVLGPSSDRSRGILFAKLGADGSHARDIWMPAGGSRQPASHATVDGHMHAIKMNGREVYKFAVVKMQQLIDEALDRVGMSPDQIKLVIPHQSNARIIESVREKLGLSDDKIVVNIDRYGNTSAASIGLALDEVRRNGRLSNGDLVLFLALGAGLTWAVMLWRV